MILGTRFQRVVAAVVVTVVTIGVIGVLLLASTPLGCGPAKAMHMKEPTRCQTVGSVSPNAFPTFPTASGHPQSANPYPQPASNQNPYPQPASNQNPYPQPASNQNPYPQPASGNPYPIPESGYFPFFGGPSSGPAGSPGLVLNCSLPIYAGGPGSGGFISFPNGSFTPDPRSAVTAPSPSPTASPTPPQYPYGYQGWWGTTYDRAYSKWLPVPYTWVSPDGSRYAYPGQPDGIYVQNVANGTQVELAEGKSWQIIDVEAAGIYAVTGATGGLWLLTFAGGVTQVASSGYWNAVGGGYAYGTATSSTPQGAGNTIIRLDLKSSSAVDYFSYPSQTSTVAGFDHAGRPVIYVQGPNLFLIYLGLPQPNQFVGIASLIGTNFWPSSLPVADTHGLWLASGSGIVLYVDGVGWFPMSTFGGQLAGGCY